MFTSSDKRRPRRSSGDDGQGDGVVKALMESNDQMGKEMEYLKNRLNALETMQQKQKQSQPPNTVLPAAAAGGNLANIYEPGGGGGGAGDGILAPSNTNNTQAQAAVGSSKRGIKWMDSMDVGVGGAATETDNIDNADGDNANKKPPMKKITFLDHHLASNIMTDSPQNNGNANNNNPSQPLDDNANADNIENASIYSSSSADSSSDEQLAFSGWARVFFQARHHRSATQITSGATSTTSQDTYLYLSIHSTANELRISNTDDRWKPPLIDPPIPLKYFYAVKVPGSRSGAALFLKNDPRRLRKYIFRFEFVNRAVHQPPARYIQFLRSGKAAKKSMRGINKMKNAFNKMGEEKKENIKADKKRAQDAFAAHLSTLDELLRESSEAAERFVECVNTKNEEEEELTRSERELRMGSGSGAMNMGESGRRRRSKPPPPYWGSGFNRPSTNEQDEEDEHSVDSESDFSEEEDELYYDDDNDDETLFDKVQVSTEQTLETLFNHIVK